MTDQDRARDAAARWWATLSSAERWDLGDAFVLDGFDWREWGFDEKPSAAFLNHVDYLRVLWEAGDA